MAYKLALPAGCLLHPVFHVSCLKPKLGAYITPFPTITPIDSDGFPTLNLLQFCNRGLSNSRVEPLLRFWSNGKGNHRKMQLGNLFTSFNFDFLTLWARFCDRKESILRVA